MGADMADINNDGYNDIFITEMLPSDYKRLKTVTTFEDWNKYQLKVKNGYYHQFTRNTLQLNNTNNSFSEIGRLSGVEASDWSWGALFFDMDHDGLKDLFIANGIYRDLTNQDYLQFISNEEVMKSIITTDSVNYSKLIEIIPSNKIKNHSYKNLGHLKFESFESGLQTESFSNGAAYGDLDNDGDLDLVVNNVNMKAFLYENTTMGTEDASYIKFVLKGANQNTLAIGSKIEITSKKQSLENQPARGFQSSMDSRPNFGLKGTDPIDIKVRWPSGKTTKLTNVSVNQTLFLDEAQATDSEQDINSIKNDLFQTTASLEYKHKENPFVDFNRDRLLVHMCSTEGPRLSSADVNGDGHDDLFIGGSKGTAPTLYLGSMNGLTPTKTNSFDKNSNSEDMSSLFFDADNDGDQDLYVCSGGVEFSQYSNDFIDRLYINDGAGSFTKSKQTLPTAKGFHSTSTVISSDIDNDGDLDLFVGERNIPLKYGSPCSGFLLQNDGKGNFTDISDQAAQDLNGIGMITDALFHDLDDDGDQDLIITGEFMGIEILSNTDGVFTKKNDNPLSNLKGWWNTIEKADLDNDGDLDFIVGNHGLNSRFRATKEKPITLFSKDFDSNGFIDPILTFRAENGKDYPYALRHDLIDQVKNLKKKFPDYDSFKDASISDMFSAENLKDANVHEVNRLSSVILINNGNYNFTITELPIEVQFSNIYAIATNDFDNDGDVDIVLGGNLYSVKPEVGRYDATRGIYLENQGGGNFKNITNGNGFFVEGQIRDIIFNKDELIVSRNSDSLALFKIRK